MLQQAGTMALCAGAAVLLWTDLLAADAIVTSAADARSFLANKAAKLVYTRWELNEWGDAGWKTGRSLWYIDLSEEVLREREIVRFADVEPRNAIVSPDGQWVTFNTFLDDDFTNAESYICRLQQNAQSTLIKIGVGGQPHWWTKPGTTEEYLIYSSGDLENTWNKYWQEKGETFIQRIDSQTKQPLGSAQQLLPYYANSGRSKAGRVIVAGSRAGVERVADTTSGSFLLKSKQITPVGPLITLLSPNGSEHYEVGDTLFVLWTADKEKIYEVDIWLTFTDRPGEIKLTTAGGIGVYTNQGVANPLWGNFSWVIPDSVKGISTLSQKCRIAIKRYNATLPEHGDKSDSVFTIAAAPKDQTDTISPTPNQEHSNKSGGGCGTGAGLAFIPPLFYALRRKAKPKSSRE
jgi:hypothetical protein